MVAKLNVTYLSLLRLGFEKDDIEVALRHTYTGESEDALDWVICQEIGLEDGVDLTAVEIETDLFVSDLFFFILFYVYSYACIWTRRNCPEGLRTSCTTKKVKKSFLRRLVMFYLIKSSLLTFELLFLAKTIEMKISVHASQPNAGHTPTLPDIAIEQPRPHTPPAREPSPPPSKALKDDTQKAWILQAALAVSLSFKLIAMAPVGRLVSYCSASKDV